MIKDFIHQGDRTILNLYALYNITQKYIKQNKLRQEGDNTEIIVMDFNVLLSLTPVNYRSNCEGKTIMFLEGNLR